MILGVKGIRHLRTIHRKLNHTASQITWEVQINLYVFKKKGSQQQNYFNRKVVKTISAAVKLLHVAIFAEAKD